LAQGSSLVSVYRGLTVRGRAWSGSSR